jgi:hypothetical protein
MEPEPTYDATNVNIRAAIMEKSVQQIAHGAGVGLLDKGIGICTLELCKVPESIKGEFESVSSSRILFLPISSDGDEMVTVFKL